MNDGKHRRLTDLIEEAIAHAEKFNRAEVVAKLREVEDLVKQEDEDMVSEGGIFRTED